MTTDRHPTDDDLVLRYYGELPGREAATIERHLRECAACGERVARLERVMRAVDAMPEPAVAAGFERDVWARLRPALRKRGQSPLSTWWKEVTVPSWAFAGGIAALVAVAFLAGALWRQIALRPASSSSVADRIVAAGSAAETTALRERLLLAAVGEHLERTELVLIELLNARGHGTIDISGERLRAEELVAENRLYRETAEGVGDQAVAAILDELDRILTEVAGGPSAVTAVDLESMRRRIEGQNILFKVQVISSELRARERDALARRSRMTS